MSDNKPSEKEGSFAEPKFIKYGCLSIGLAGIALCGVLVLSVIIVLCMMIPHCSAFLLFNWLATTFAFSLPLTVAAALKAAVFACSVISAVFSVSLGFCKPHSKIRTALNVSWRGFKGWLKGVRDFVLMRGKIKRLTEERDVAIEAKKEADCQLAELQEERGVFNGKLQKHDISIQGLRQECANKRWFIQKVDTITADQNLLHTSCLSASNARDSFYGENVSPLYKNLVNVEREEIIKKLIADHKDGCFVYIGSNPSMIKDLNDPYKWLARMGILLPDDLTGIGGDIPGDLDGVLKFRGELNAKLIARINEFISIRQSIYLICFPDASVGSYRKELSAVCASATFFSTPVVKIESRRGATTTGQVIRGYGVKS